MGLVSRILFDEPFNKIKVFVSFYFTSSYPAYFHPNSEKGGPSPSHSTHKQKGPVSRDIYESRHNIAERIQWPPTQTMNGNLHPEAAELEKKFSADEHGESGEKTETYKVKTQ